MPLLLSSDPAVAKQRFRLAEQVVTLGRHPDCEVIIEAGAVSRRHAQIERKGNDYYISDLGSRNGTIVNRNVIDGPTRLFDGAEISICDVLLVFQTGETAAREQQKSTLDAERKDRMTSSFLLDDSPDVSSTIMGQIEVPSHHSGIDTGTGTEAKLKAIISVTEALGRANEPRQILDSVVETLFQLFVEADRGFVALREDDGRIVPFLMQTRRKGDEENVRISRTIVNTVMESQQAVLSTDAAADSRFDMSASLADFRIRSMMAAPLVNAAGKSTGIIQIDSLRPTMAFSQGDLEVLVTVAGQASLALQKFELYREAEETRRMEQDLQLAHEVQLRFLPETPPALPGYSFHSWYQAATHVGGDYFDYIELGQGRVVGHGVAAALLMAKIAAESRFALAMLPDPVAAVTRINRAMSGMNLDRFVTFLLCLVDVDQPTIKVVNAGHMPPIICAPDGSIEVMAATCSGLPLGVMEDFEYESVDLELRPGTTMILHTDGEELTTERVVQDLKSAQAKSPAAIGKSVRESVSRHVGDSPQTDDICLVCVGRGF
jgi:phosphoserine phosphatase RsbU/P